MLKAVLHAARPRARDCRRTTSCCTPRRSPTKRSRVYHWHIEIMPKLTRVGRLRVGHRVLTSTRRRRRKATQVLRGGRVPVALKADPTVWYSERFVRE